ncbi:glycosyltransferase [Pseudoalteromonas sp. SR45-1]|uniref:glycosyltransferase n=1 Tax=Pseudoalteromonas sp. SR45-1 TaxID=2760932 RepID=UPI0016020ED2|nr:glycosyltransferase [Pseudoalteromonas sp. SR45-1]MBB1325767.1 glycosyltransferase [Pseudoalteromonas sp. SR45-1]
MSVQYIFIPDFSGGGAEKLFIKFAHFSKNSNRPIKILSLSRVGPYYDWCKKNNIEVVSLGLKKTSSKWLLFPIVLFRLIKLLSSGDRILSAVFFCNLVSAIASLFINIKLVASQHTVKSVKDIRNNRVIYFFIRLLTQFSFKHSSKVICVSDSVRNDLIENYNIDKSKLVVINNAVAESVQNIGSLISLAENPVNGSFNILCVGRLINDKGFDLAIQSTASLVHKGIDVHLDILGSGPELNNLRAIVKELKIESNVTFHGFSNNLSDFYSAANVVLIPSRLEGFGNVAVEALCYSKPVVVSNCPGGLSEIVSSDLLGSVVDLSVESIVDGLMHWKYNNSLESAKYRVDYSRRYLPEVLFLDYFSVLDD